MYQWRKFDFFEEKSSGKAPTAISSEISSGINCCSSGRGKISLGCDDGTVGILDRGFKISYGFQAHASSVIFLQQLKVILHKTILMLTFDFVPPFKFHSDITQDISYDFVDCIWILGNSLKLYDKRGIFTSPVLGSITLKTDYNINNHSFMFHFFLFIRKKIS